MTDHQADCIHILTFTGGSDYTAGCYVPTQSNIEDATVGVDECRTTYLQITRFLQKFAAIGGEIFALNRTSSHMFGI